jgi:predicted nucleotidyltransferase
LTEPRPAPTLASLRARRDEILRIAARHGARNVRVFGSVAVGYANPESDVDLLVDLEPGRTLLDLGSLSSDLEEVLGRKVDVLETPRRRTRAATQIRREAVPL